MNKIKKIFLISTLISVFAVGIFTTSAYDSLVGQDISLVYASHTPGFIKKDTLSVSLLGTSHNIKDNDTDSFLNHRKKIYLSPDRKLIAVSTEPYEHHGSFFTYILDINGNQITKPYPGNFVSWSPDSSKILVFIPNSVSEDGRRIYFLSKDDIYLDSGLPEGTISADISSKDGSVVYTSTHKGTDESSIYIKDLQGNIRLLLTGNKNIFVWVRWSPSGDKISFLQSDLGLSRDSQFISVINEDGTDLNQISKVEWGYPPVWSSDGTRILFASNRNLQEYNTVSKSIEQKTNFVTGDVKYPSYSSDDKTIVFSYNALGIREIWSLQDKEVVQLTDSGGGKTYPLLP